MLLKFSDLSDKQQENLLILEKWKLLSIIHVRNERFFSKSQFSRIENLMSFSVLKEDFSLFNESRHAVFMSSKIAITQRAPNHTSIAQKSISIKDAEMFLHVFIQIIVDLVNESPDADIKQYAQRIELFGTELEVLIYSDFLYRKIKIIVDSFHALHSKKTSFFSGSASYLGSKSLLTPALVSIVDYFFPKDTIVIDLMCGSGAVSGALSSIRATYASDSQEFSKLLAIVQSGGMTETKALNLISAITASARTHFLLLESMLKDHLNKEDDFLSQEFSVNLFDDFHRWMIGYPRVGTDSFNKKHEINIRRDTPWKEPGVLFSLYYANLFFGVKQAAEIDSLRIAIESINDEFSRKWALGVLVIAASACADNYGGHFAQPKAMTSERSEAFLRKMFNKRSLSVVHEFSIRLLSLAKEGEKNRFNVDLIDGPWDEALKQAKNIIMNDRVIVYIDPPYTRDEYSRYYHVLETLVKYNYPEVSGKGSVPIKPEWRFSSEFFSRDSRKIENIIAEILSHCLANNWYCLWSYSDSATADMIEIISKISIRFSNISIFSTPYSYKGKKEKVTEYVIMISP